MVELRKRMRPLLGTYVEVGVKSSARNAEEIFNSAFSAIDKVQSLMSFHDPHSELTQLNQSVGHFIPLDPLTIKVLRLCKAVYKASSGLFNPAVGGELVRRGYLPSHSKNQNSFENEDAIIHFGSGDDIEISGHRARLRRPVRIVLDGIAKGFAVDGAMKCLRDSGAQAAWINAGGDIRVFGDLVLPIFRPDLNGELQALGSLKNAAIATSRMTQGYSKRHPGWITSPHRNSIQESIWSIVSTTAWRADALAKVACLAPPEHRNDLISRLGGVCVQPVETKSA